jgi:ABC-2 type transport system ATP-binding protein
VSGSEITARGLSRTFRGSRWTFGPRASHTALDRLDLDIAPGERVALLGPNGAGKSTTVKLLCGVLAPSAGTLAVGGRSPHRERSAHVRQLGVVFGQRSQLWWDLTVADGLGILAELYGGAPRRAALVEALGAGPLLHRRVRTLSLGERTRCELIAALQHGPGLLLLDEPTIGLDAAARLVVRRAVQELAAETGATVVLTSHDLGDVRAVCERVVLLHQGRVLFDGDMDGLVERLGGQRRLVVTVAAPLPSRPEILGGQWDAEGLRFTVGFSGPAPKVLAELTRALGELGAELEDIAVLEPDIDEVVAGAYGEWGG